MKLRLRRPLAMLLTVVMLLGLLPAAAFAAGGEGAETKLTALTLTQSDGTQVADLLSSTETDPVTLDGYTAYTLNIGVALDTSSQESKTLTIQLPNGMQFVNMDEDALKENNSAIAGVNWVKGESIYEGVYRPNNGTVTITFSSGAAAANFGLSVQPDMAFFPAEKKESGMEVQDAISVTLAEGETQGNTVNKDVLVTTTRNLNDLNIVNVELPKQNVAAGSDVDLGTANVLVGFFSSGQTQTKRLNDEVKVTFSVPAEITFESSTLGEPEIESGQDGNATWTFTVANQYTTSRSLQLVVEIPGNASLNKSYEIKILEISTKGYGQTNPHTKTFDNSTIWTLTVVDPSDVLLGVTPLPATNVYNFTKNGNDTQSFSDYNTLLASAKITNDGLAAIDKNLIYEAKFDQTIQFVTAVGIPCDWDDSYNDGLPTKITVTGSNNEEYVLDSPKEIRAAASLPCADYGFILRTENIPKFPTSVSIQSVKVELPSLPEDYQSTGQFPVFEGNNINNAYAGVWGRIKPNVSDGNAGKNQFRIYEAEEGTSEDSWTTATTTVRDTSKITGADYLSNQLTVNGRVVSAVNSGDTLHVWQEITPANYHEQSSSETILLNPVIYVVEPAGMTIANETFSAKDGTTVPTYTKTEITERVSSSGEWTEGYKLYQYTFNNTLLLGWWDGDWSSTSLIMDFDYQISRTAKTATYNVWDLIFYKSALDMEFTRNGKEDTYGLNGDKLMGRVDSKTFTVNTRNVFEIVSQIQMEGQGDHWYEYNPDNPGATTAVFTSGATAKVKINIMNNTAGDAKNVVVYIPVPKEGLNLGNAFGLMGTAQFDMCAAGVDGDLPAGWTVEYGTATGTFGGTNADDLTLQTGTTWANTPTNAHNIIKLTLSEDATLEPGETADIILKFTATDNAGQTNRTNIFKSWYQYTAGSGNSSFTMVTPKETANNFACRLQNGKLSGTIYIDSNGNGQMDTGENGLDGVTVEITTGISGQSTQTTTADGGKYSFNSLPSNEKIIVTIINPGSPNASAAQPYRFSTYAKSEGTTIGTDVTATGDGQKGTTTLETLGDSGAAVVNAGLTVPVTVTLSAGDRGTVNPSSVKVFAGGTIADGLGNNEAITVTANTGWKFAGTWLKGEGTENTISDSNLKSQKVSGPVTYTAQFVAVPVGTITGNTNITLHTPTTDNPNSTTLTVSLSNQSDLTGDITYQWQKFNGTGWEDVTGATEASLFLTGLKITDNGAKYQCVVTNGGNSATIGPVTLSVQKGRQDKPTVSYINPSTIGGTGSIGTGESGKLTTAMEYNTDNGGKWTKVDETTADNGITNIAADTTYYIRYAETDYLNAGAAQVITIDSFNPNKEPTPNGSFEASTMTLSGVENGQEYRIGDEGKWTEITGTTVDLSDAGLKDGDTIQIYKPGNGTTTTDSDTQTITLTQAAKPSGTATNETSYESKDGSITITDYNSSYTYQISSDNGSAWTDAKVSSSGVISNLAPGSYVIRVMGSGNMLASEPSDTLTVDPYVRSSEAKITSFKVTVDGKEYTGVIDQEDGTITVTLPAGTDPSVLDSLTPAIEYTGQSLTPASGTEQNFSGGGVTYTVTAEDGTIKSYTATITIAQPDTYTITVTGMEHGSITTDPSGAAAENATVTLTITPAQGYQLKEGSLKVTYQDDEQTVAVTDNKFTMPAADVTVSAEFEAIQYTITYVLNDGINNASNPDHYTVEQNISLTAPTKDGYTFTGWTWDGQTTPQQNVNISAGDITGNLTFTAHWEYEDIPTPPTEHTVTVKGSHAATTGAGSYAEGASVTIQAGTREGYTFAGWTVTPESVTLNNADSATTTFTMPGEDVTVTATWTKDEEPGPTPAGAITVTPADIIIYMGGNSGYEGAVNDDGEIEASKSLPEPGFVFDLPDELESALAENSTDITAVTFQNEDGSKTWKVQLYQGLDESARDKLYTIVPTYDKPDPVRVVFTDGDKHIVSDEFTVGLEINKDFGMSLYTGPAGTIKAVYDGKKYPVELGEGTLTVLGTTEKVSITTVTDQAPTNGQPGAIADAGTTYTINDSEVAVRNGDVSLLFDSIINHIGNDRTSKLEERASEWLAEEGIVPTAQHQFVYELKYLDLVDANNGNAWVTASDDLTIYWPLPAGADADSLKVLHFKGLHREMTYENIPTAIANAEVEKIDAKVENGYVVFQIGESGFSPFALVWEEAIPENTFIITASAGSGGSINPSGTVTVTAGSSQTFSITPNGGYHIEDVLVDGTSVGAVSSYTFSNVQGNHTIHAVFDSNGGGSVTTPRYIIEAEAGQGGEISPDGRVRVARGSDKTFTITPDKGYRIADVLVDGRSIGVVSRYTFENVRSDHTIEVIFEKYSSVADPDDTGVSEWLDTSDHRDFLHGYTDGTFGPNRNMTRGEVAQMFYNLLLEQEVPQTTVFTDVPADMWCADAVNTLASLGIVEGIGKGLYAPDRAITRAEFTVIAMRFAKLDTSGENIFSDVDTGDWFYEQVVGSIKYGWIQGYADGTFRPDNTITRAEVTTITNRMLGRAADEAFVDRHSDELRQFPDVPESYWAYYNIMEATNAHDFGMENGTEDWTGLN